MKPNVDKKLWGYASAIAVTIIALASCYKTRDPEPKPVAEFEVETTGRPGEIYIVNHSKNAETYSWDLGDGETSTTDEPAHTYAANGKYKITLIAEGPGGEDTYSRTVTISNIPDRPVNGPSTGNATFFTSQSSGWSSIDVWVDNVLAGTLPGRYFSSTPQCFAGGTVTITKAPGTYSYSARSNTGVSWQGYLTITPNGCQVVRLDFPTSANAGQVAFWTSQSSGWSSIEVTVSGVAAGAINGIYFSSTPSCSASGTVTVSRSPGTYPYTAKSNTGVTWNGTVTISANRCTTVRLDF